MTDPFPHHSRERGNDEDMQALDSSLRENDGNLRAFDSKTLPRSFEMNHTTEKRS
ncbi:MAG: hypothetical protein LBI87_08305 [Candidatus Accumulibacter sp.]|jgi:hypothetical protein|nr:hypothetical protein [Accumulibacter sp.]